MEEKENEENITKSFIKFIKKKNFNIEIDTDIPDFIDELRRKYERRNKR